MGARRTQQRTPHLYRPWLDILIRALVLILTFGMMLVGVHEAWLARDHGWMWFFVAGAAATVVLYTGCVWDYITWLDYEYPEPTPSSPADYRTEEKSVDSAYDGRHRRAHP